MTVDTQTTIDGGQAAASAVEAAATAVAAHVGGRGAVQADANAMVTLMRFAEAKRALDAAEKRVDDLKPEVHSLFDAHRADQFVDAQGEVILTRCEVLNQQQHDMALIERRAPKLFEESKKPRTTHWRINLPRIKRK